MNRRSIGARVVAFSPVLLFVAWGVIGFNLLSPQPSSTESPWLASKRLLAGHRLVREDVKYDAKSEHEHPGQVLEGLLGRYLNKDIPQEGIRIGPADVSPHPIIKPSSGNLVYFAPFDGSSQLRLLLDAGSFVTLCWAAATECIPDRRVIAVTCDDDGKSCVAITEIPSSELKTVGTHADLRVFLQDRKEWSR